MRREALTCRTMSLYAARKPRWTAQPGHRVVGSRVQRILASQLAREEVPRTEIIISEVAGEMARKARISVMVPL